MSKPIKSYDDLLVYQQQLKELMMVQKQVIRYDIEELKEDVQNLIVQPNDDLNLEKIDLIKSLRRLLSRLEGSDRDQYIAIILASHIENLTREQLGLRRL